MAVVMGETAPPTAADRARDEARHAKAAAQGATMRIQLLESRLTDLEDTFIEALRLIDGVVSELSTRITRLEGRQDG